jgi:hypothetical protein
MPSMMSWSSNAVTVMPSRAARDANLALAVSLIRNDVLVATAASFALLRLRAVYRNVALMRYKV